MAARTSSTSSKSSTSKKDEQGSQSAKGSLSRTAAGAPEGVESGVVVRGKAPSGAAVQPKVSQDAQRQSRKDDRQVESRQVSNPDLVMPKRDKALEEVREARQDRINDLAFQGRTEVAHEIHGVVDSAKKDDDGGTLLVESVGGHVFVSCDRKEIVLDHDGVADLQRVAQQLFQAAS